MQTQINFILGKNGGHRPSSLGCRLIVAVRQADEKLAVHKILKFDNLNSKARLGCLNGFMAPIASYQLINGQYLKETLLYSWFFRHRKTYIPCHSLLLIISTIVLNDSMVKAGQPLPNICFMQPLRLKSVDIL